MKVRPLLCCLVLCALPAGCSFAPYAFRNLTEAPLDVLDRACLRCRFRHEADLAWEHVVKATPNNVRSRLYAYGFKEGFVEFLDGDGTGEPPAAPPWRYRAPWFLTPEGRREVEDWFAGYRHGAALARASGIRETVVVPLALPPIHATLGAPEVPQSPPAAERPADLPSPRLLPAPADNAAPPKS